MQFIYNWLKSMCSRFYASAAYKKRVLPIGIAYAIATSLYVSVHRGRAAHDGGQVHRVLSDGFSRPIFGCHRIDCESGGGTGRAVGLDASLASSRRRACLRTYEIGILF